MKSKIAHPFIILFTIFIGCGYRSQIYQETKFLMNTYVEIKIFGEKDEKKSKNAITLAFQEMEILAKLLNCHDKNSNISKLNTKGRLRSDGVLSKLITKSVECSKLTNGAFDITVYPLMKLWDFKNKTQPPTKSRIKQLLPKVNYKLITVYNNRIKLMRGAEIDLGGIAKGYVVDSAIEILKTLNIKNAFINAGGDIRVLGDKEWKIGIQHPRKQKGEIIGIIPVRNKAIVTSGDYEQYFEHEGIRYHHIINPKTGYPTNDCISVTIIAEDTITADALSTGIFVMGTERGMELIENLDGIEGIIISKDKKIHFSKGLKEKTTKNSFSF